MLRDAPPAGSGVVTVNQVAALEVTTTVVVMVSGAHVDLSLLCSLWSACRKDEDSRSSGR